MLDALSGGLADQHPEIAAHVADDGFVEAVAADPHRAGVNDAVQRDDRHLRGAATDVQHHRPARFLDRNAGADGRRHGLGDQVHHPRAGAHRRFTDRPPLHLGGTAGHADQDPRTGVEKLAGMHFADKVLQHLFGDGEIGDHAVFHRPDGGKIVGCAAQHPLGVRAHRRDGANPPNRVLIDGDHRGFVEDDAASPNINQRVSGPQIDREIVGELAAQPFEHVVESPIVRNG